MAFRQLIAQFLAARAASSSLSSVAVAPLVCVVPGNRWAPLLARVTSVGNRWRPHHGGPHERRIRRTATCHYSPPRRPPCQVHLPGAGPVRVLVPQVVAPLPRLRQPRPLRPDPRPPGPHAHPARVGAHHPVHPAAPPGPRPAADPLRP